MSLRNLRVGVVGATGLVGRTMLKVLEERGLGMDELRLFASERSAGSKIDTSRGRLTVQAITDHAFEGLDIALFSAGSDVSKRYAPVAARSGCVVIDNSSAWRMHPECPLVVPEVNAHALERHRGIIANPNCSTIQLVVALKPVHERFGLKRVVVSTYQSVSGAGQDGVDQLMAELRGENSKKSPFPHPVAFNTVFHTIGEPGGFSEEERKVRFETLKIMELPDLRMAVTCVRVPVLGGHGESVLVETERPISRDALFEALSAQPGIVVKDDAASQVYPTVRDADDKDEVFVGRLRIDDTVDNGAYMWIVSDNLRKGAATNAVQIAQILAQRPAMNFSPIEAAPR